MKTTTDQPLAPHREQLPGMQAPKPLVRRLVSDPLLDWALILAVSGIVALVLVITGVSVYLSTDASLASPPTVVAATAPKFDSSLLAGVLQDFDTRAAIQAAHAADYPLPPDPSLP